MSGATSTHESKGPFIAMIHSFFVVLSLFVILLLFVFNNIEYYILLFNLAELCKSKRCHLLEYLLF